MSSNGESPPKKKNRVDTRNDPKLFLTLERIARKPVPKRMTLAVFAKTDHQFQQKDDAPLYFTDIQSLLMSIAFNQAQLNWPRWCRLLKPSRIEKTVVVLCDRVTAKDIDCISEKTGLPFVPSFLNVNIDVPSPHSYSCLPEKELLSIPLQFLTAAARERSMKHLSIKDGSRITENALVAVDVKLNKESDNTSETEESTFARVHSTERHKWGLSMWQRDRFPRTLLLLGPSQLSLENYPLPGETGVHAYLATHDVYEDVTDTSPMLSLDCEMVLTQNTPAMELARITLVNEAHEIVYDSLVKPQMPVINYLTSKSGITKKMLKNVTKTLKDVQMDVMEMLPANAILIGQSLNCDLQAMQMFHPYCIDTSVIFNLTGVRQRKPGLRLLTSKFLQREIQTNKRGHCSAEDSIAAMQLVQLKLQRSLEFGDATSGQWNNAELDRAPSDGESEGPAKKRPRTEEEAAAVATAAEQPVQHVRLTSPATGGSSEEDSPCAEDCGKAPDEAALSDALRRHRQFLSVHGTSPWCRHLFSLLAEAGISSVLLDNEERCQSSFPAEALDSLTSLVVSRKDRRLVSAVDSAVADHQWSFVRLHQHVEREEARDKCVTRLRRYIEKINAVLPPHSLLMVLVSGHPDRQKETARCYSGLKPRGRVPDPEASAEDGDASS